MGSDREGLRKKYSGGAASTTGVAMELRGWGMGVEKEFARRGTLS